MIKTLVFFTLLLGIISKSSYAQVQTGGNVGINISNNILIIDFSPEVDYVFDSNIIIGFSPFVLYSKNIVSQNKIYYAGTRFFSEYTFDEGMFIHAEYEASKLYNIEGWSRLKQSIPLGAGYIYEISSNTIAYGMILYDVLYDPLESVKSNPIIRAGVRYRF